jgi:hypothetical protein
VESLEFDSDRPCRAGPTDHSPLPYSAPSADKERGPNFLTAAADQ